MGLGLFTSFVFLNFTDSSLKESLNAILNLTSFRCQSEKKEIWLAAVMLKTENGELKVARELLFMHENKIQRFRTTTRSP